MLFLSLLIFIYFPPSFALNGSRSKDRVQLQHKVSEIQNESFFLVAWGDIFPSRAVLFIKSECPSGNRPQKYTFVDLTSFFAPIICYLFMDFTNFKAGRSNLPPPLAAFGVTILYIYHIILTLNDRPPINSSPSQARHELGVASHHLKNIFLKIFYF